MIERAGRAAAVAAVVVAGAVSGGLVAVALAGDDGPDPPGDADVVAALATRYQLDDDAAGCVLGRLVVAGVLDDGLRQRLVDATDAVADVPAMGEAVAACTPPVDPVGGPLPSCTGARGDDPAAVEVCAVEALVGILRADAGLDSPTASCAAEAVVDELGAPAVIEALDSSTLPPDLRQRLQAAFAACG